MMEQIRMIFTDFDPSGLNKYLQDKYSSVNEDARKMMSDLQLLLRDDIISKLKEHFVGPNDRWFYEGIPEGVRTDIAQRQQTDPEHLEILNYFDLPHYEKIISHNWELFKDTYGFKENGTSKAKQLSWFDTLVKIRNKISHPERGKVTLEEFNSLKNYFYRLKQVIPPKTGLSLPST